MILQLKQKAPKTQVRWDIEVRVAFQEPNDSLDEPLPERLAPRPKRVGLYAFPERGGSLPRLQALGFPQGIIPCRSHCKPGGGAGMPGPSGERLLEYGERPWEVEPAQGAEAFPDLDSIPAEEVQLAPVIHSVSPDGRAGALAPVSEMQRFLLLPGDVRQKRQDILGNHDRVGVWEQVTPGTLDSRKALGRLGTLPGHPAWLEEKLWDTVAHFRLPADGCTRETREPGDRTSRWP